MLLKIIEGWVDMNIGIDIDGVLTDVRKFTIEAGIKYCKENKKGKLVNPDAYNSVDYCGLRYIINEAGKALLCQCW